MLDLFEVNYNEKLIIFFQFSVLDRELGEIYSTNLVRNWHSVRNVCQDQEIPETQFLSFQSGGCGQGSSFSNGVHKKC